MENTSKWRDRAISIALDYMLETYEGDDGVSEDSILDAKLKLD